MRKTGGIARIAALGMVVTALSPIIALGFTGYFIVEAIRTKDFCNDDYAKGSTKSKKAERNNADQNMSECSLD